MFNINISFNSVYGEEIAEGGFINTLYVCVTIGAMQNFIQMQMQTLTLTLSVNRPLGLTHTVWQMLNRTFSLTLHGSINALSVGLSMHWNLPFTDHSQLVWMRIQNLSDIK